MNEQTSAPEKHMLQAICERAAAKVSETVGNRCSVTLLAFYKHVLATGHAFASSLPDQEAVAITIDALVAQSCGAPTPARNPGAWLPEESALSLLREQARELLPFSCGFVLIFGAGVDNSWVSSEEIEPMRGFLVHIALPQFREAAGG